MLNDKTAHSHSLLDVGQEKGSNQGKIFVCSFVLIVLLLLCCLEILCANQNCEKKFDKKFLVSKSTDSSPLSVDIWVHQLVSEPGCFDMN